MPSDTTFIVVRHGESDANRRDIISDKQVDHPLSERGIAQAKETAECLKAEKLDLIVSSTRQRALETANIINEFHNVQTILTDDLIERDYGIFSGVAKSKANEIMMSEGFEWLNIPRSESAFELDRRVEAVTSMVLTDHAGLRVLISTHEDIVRSFFRVLAGKSDAESVSLKIENSKPYTFVQAV